LQPCQQSMPWHLWCPYGQQQFLKHLQDQRGQQLKPSFRRHQSRSWQWLVSLLASVLGVAGRGERGRTPGYNDAMEQGRLQSAPLQW